MRKLVVAVVIASLMGCTLGHRDPVEAKQALNEAINNSNSNSLDELPASVQADLMPELTEKPSGQFASLKRFQVQANSVDAKTFFTS